MVTHALRRPFPHRTESPARYPYSTEVRLYYRFLSPLTDSLSTATSDILRFLTRIILQTSGSSEVEMKTRDVENDEDEQTPIAVVLFTISHFSKSVGEDVERAISRCEAVETGCRSHTNGTASSKQAAKTPNFLIIHFTPFSTNTLIMLY